jgi:hypothetical protein
MTPGFPRRRSIPLPEQAWPKHQRGVGGCHKAALTDRPGDVCLISGLVIIAIKQRRTQIVLVPESPVFVRIRQKWVQISECGVSAYDIAQRGNAGIACTCNPGRAKWGDTPAVRRRL